MTTGYKNLCKKVLIDKVNGKNWVNWPCFGITQSIIFRTELSSIRLHGIDVYGSEVEKSSDLMDLLPTDDCSIMGINSNIICGQFCFWENYWLDKSINDNNPFLLLDDDFDSCINFSEFKQFFWNSVLPANYIIEKIVIFMNTNGFNGDLNVTFTFKDDKSLGIEKFSERLTIIDGIRQYIINTSLSIQPSRVNVSVDDNSQVDFCEFQLYGSKISDPKYYVKKSPFAVSFSNHYNCTSSNLVKDSKWQPSIHYCPLFYGKTNGLPWLKLNLIKSYLITSVLLSYNKDIISADISLLGTSRGLEYLNERDYPFNSQRRICQTNIDLKMFSKEIFCQEYAYGNYLYISSLNHTSTFSICELSIYGYLKNFTNNEKLLRMVSNVTSNQLIRLDGISNVTSLSLSSMEYGHGSFVIYALSKNITTGNLTKSEIIYEYHGSWIKNNDILNEIPNVTAECLQFRGNFTSKFFLRVFGIFERGSLYTFMFILLSFIILCLSY